MPGGIQPEGVSAGPSNPGVDARAGIGDQAAAGKAHGLDPKGTTALCLMGLVCERTNQHDHALQTKSDDPLAIELMANAK